MKVSPMRLLGFMVIAVAVLCIAACKKEGINQNLDPNNQKPYDFMSTKVGSFWRYGTNSGVPYTRYARNKDSIKNGKLYSYYERNEDTSGWYVPEYFGKNGTYYITLIDLDGIAENDNYLETVFWIENAKPGDSWTNTGSTEYPGLGKVNVYTNSTEIEDNVVLQLAGKTFTNVVHVHSDIRTVSFNMRIGGIDMWFLKDVGILKEEAHINIAGAYRQDHIDSLLDYHIEP